MSYNRSQSLIATGAERDRPLGPNDGRRPQRASPSRESPGAVQCPDDFRAGEFFAQFSVKVIPNTRDDGDRTFNVVLSAPTGGMTLGSPSTATVTIKEDDDGGIVQFTAPVFTVSECAAAPCSAVLTLQRSNIASNVSVDYATVDGTASALSDYVATTGTVSFAGWAGEPAHHHPVADRTGGPADQELRRGAQQHSGRRHPGWLRQRRGPDRRHEVAAPSGRRRRRGGRRPCGTMGAVRDRVALPLIGALSLVIVLLVGYLLLGHAPGRGGRTDVAALPTLNALLNGACAVCLTAGWVFIRRRRIAAHRACMLAAFAFSTLFLISYVVYHALAGSRPFTGQGAIRWIYFPCSSRTSCWPPPWCPSF